MKTRGRLVDHPVATTGADLPTRGPVIRLVGMFLAEQDHEWQDGRCYLRPETMVLLDAQAPEEVGPALLMAS